jgi:dTDP-glucose pyrophosphorylase
MKAVILAGGLGTRLSEETSIPSFKWIPLIVFEKWTLTKNLTNSDTDAGAQSVDKLEVCITL